MRVGRRHDPRYRVVLVPKRSSPQGKYLEHFGTYDPRADTVQIKEERVRWWLERGAQPSDTAHNILVKLGIRPGPKRKKHHVAKKETAVEAAAGTVQSGEQTVKEET